jgi:serine/threonine protein kinase/Flp pilus assembly protein TadD
VNADRARRIRDLYGAAASLAGDERARFLASGCAGDAALRDEVEALLAHAPATEDLPVTPITPVPRPRDVPGPESLSIEGYRLLRTIGSGGMGVVYEAEQLNPPRRVALKLLRAGGADDDLRARLFRREIETLARLDHPGIARIYESGETRDGLHFFAMELVDGVPLSAFMKRALAGPVTRDGRNKLLALFRGICRAVHFAHQNGVIHRDLKPANVLIVEGSSPGTWAEEPVPKVLDFGLARITVPGAERSLVTEAGTIRGTLEYMSPEQARGMPNEIDLRGDVYSLGAILYQMLSGRLPCPVRDVPVPEALRRICEEEPLPLRRARPDAAWLDQELEAIAGKALAKDPAQRYQSAHALAEDITRYLESRPIEAKPPSTMYQVRKLVGRHKVQATLLALLALSIVVFAASMTVLYTRAERNLHRALEAEVASAREADRARRVSGFLIDTFEKADPEHSSGETVTARQLLDAGVTEIDAELSHEPAAQAALLRTMGAAYRGLGLYRPAGELLERSLQTSRAVGEATETAWSETELGWLRFVEGRYDEGLEVARRALELMSTAVGPEHPNLAEVLDLVGSMHWARGEYAEAESTSVRSLRLLERAYGRENERVAGALNDVANVYLALGRLDDAEPMFLEATAIRERLFGREHPRAAVSMTNLGDLYRKQKRYAEAEAALLRGLAADEKVRGPDHPTLAYEYNNLAMVYQDMDRLEEAERAYRRAVEIREKALPPDHPLLAWTLDNLGVLYIRAKRLDDAEPVLDRALAIAEKAVGPDHPDYAIVLGNRALLREQQGRVAEAVPLRERAVSIYEKVYGGSHPYVAGRLDALADDLEKLGDHGRAADLRRRIVAVLEGKHGPDQADVLAARRDLEAALARAGGQPRP